MSPSDILLLLFKHIVVAVHKVALVVSEVHASAAAELPHLAVGTLAALGPLAVAEGGKPILPYIPEPIPIDVALSIVATHAGAARDVAIDT